MNPLGAAMGLFTVIPMRPFTVDRKVAARAMAAFPWLGLLLGAAAGALSYGVWLLAGPFLAAVLALGFLALVTGALHLDGVADTADGMGSRRAPEEALRIMRKSDIGPMGVVTLFFVLLINVAALASLGGPLQVALGLMAAAAVGRLAVTLAAVSENSARQQGFGALFVGSVRPVTATLTSLAVVAVILGAAWWVGSFHVMLATGIGLASAALFGALWSRRLLRRIGGWTGDTFGSLIEVTQAVFLVAFALAM